MGMVGGNAVIPGAAEFGDNIVLIGPMGAGKTSVARELARLTARRWTDTDKQVVQQAGLAIAEIFAQHGEPHFRRLETEALHSLASAHRLIVATGGGIVTQPGNAALLRTLGCVAFLTATEEVLFERVSRNRQRPLLRTQNPRAALRDLLQRRQPLYVECAHFTLDTSSGTHAEIAQAVLRDARRFFAERGQPSSLP